jgi:uncharacterized protein YqgV (UPF0045/DUF77 family)
MRKISVQISVYPLRQAELGPTISAVLDAFRVRGADIRIGAMSTVILGDPEVIFDALKASFESAAALGDVVMVTSISNCCPIEATDQ